MLLWVLFYNQTFFHLSFVVYLFPINTYSKSNGFNTHFSLMITLSISIIIAGRLVMEKLTSDHHHNLVSSQRECNSFNDSQNIFLIYLYLTKSSHILKVTKGDTTQILQSFSLSKWLSILRRQSKLQFIISVASHIRGGFKHLSFLDNV